MCASAWRRRATSRRRTTGRTSLPASFAPTRRNGSAWSSKPTCAPSNLDQQEVVRLELVGVEAGENEHVARAEVDGGDAAAADHHALQLGKAGDTHGAQIDQIALGMAEVGDRVGARRAHDLTGPAAAG